MLTITACVLLYLTFEASLTVASDEGLDALSSPLSQSVHHEEQQREDQEGRDAADDETHAAGHRVEQTTAIYKHTYK